MSEDNVEGFTPYDSPKAPPLYEEGTDDVKPWGPGWSLIWAFVVICVWVLAQTFIMIGLSFQKFGKEGLTADGLEKFADIAMSDGDYMGLIAFGSAMAGCLMILGIVHVRGIGFAKGLSLRKPRKWWMWLLLFPSYILGALLIAAVTAPFKTDMAAEDQAQIATMVANTDSFFLLFLGVSVGAPLFEEFLFRGLLHEGLRQSFLGRIGSGLLTAVVFAVIHRQYSDPSAFVALFMLGCYFTLARELTGSLWASVTMHFIQNTFVTVAMYMSLNGMIPDEQLPEEFRNLNPKAIEEAA